MTPVDQPLIDAVPVNRFSRASIGICVVLVALVWIVFGQTLRHGFINFDDNKYVYENAQVSSGLSVHNLAWAFTHSHSENWHPLTTLTHMFDCQLYGLNASGHHFTNVFLQSVAVVLLFFALRQLTGSLWRSAFVAALFAIHPLRVESVAWVAARKDVLSGVFFAATLLTYARYARAPSATRYLLLTVLFGFGVMSKPTLVTLPFLLLLLDYWPRFAGANFTAGLREREDANRSREAGNASPARTSVRETERTENRISWTKLILEKIPLFALSAASCAVTIWAQRPTISSLGGLPFSWRMENAIVSLVIYLRQLVWPTNLALFYPHPRGEQSLPLVLSAASAILAITLFAIFLRKKYPYLFVGWLWYVGMLVPMLGLVQVGLQAHADRYTYLPHVGLLIALSWGFVDLTKEWRHRTIVLRFAAAAIILVLTACSFQQTIYWRDSISIWTHTLAVTRNNDTAHLCLAEALLERGKLEDAIAHSQAAIEIRPANAGAYGRVPMVLTPEQAQSAISYWQNRLKANPLDTDAHNNLGVVLIQSGDPRGAIAQWETTLAIKPNDGNAQNNLAWVLATYPEETLRNGKRAVELAEKAVALPGGQDPIVLRTLAAAYAEAGEFSKAIAMAEEAARSASARQNSSLTETLQNEIALYRANKPYREIPRRQ